MTNEIELRNKLAKLQHELYQNNEERQTKEAHIHDILSQLSDNTCKNCIAGLDGYVHESGGYCEDCAKYNCIYCRGSECSDLIPINDKLDKMELNRLSYIISFEILEAVNLHPETMNELLELLKKLELI